MSGERCRNANLPFEPSMRHKGKPPARASNGGVPAMSAATWLSSAFLAGWTAAPWSNWKAAGEFLAVSSRGLKLPKLPITLLVASASSLVENRA
jgi:hypothetical protein